MGSNSWDTPTEINGWVPTVERVVASKTLDLDFIQAQGAPTTLASDTAIDNTTITLTDPTGFIDKNIVGVFSSGGEFYFASQIGAPAGNVITVDTPLDNIFLSGSNVLRASNNMAVNGTLNSPQIFQIGPIGADLVVDIVRINGFIQTSTAMDLSLFGDLAALTNGLVFRKSNGSNENKWNAKTNGRLKLLSGIDLDITDRVPGQGSEGLNVRMSYNGKDKHNSPIRLEAHETLELLVQDSLSGLEIHNWIAQGDIVPYEI